MKAPLDCGHQEFPDDGSNGMPEYYCVQKAVTVVRFSKEVKRPAILASIAEDDGTAFQYPAFICGQGEARLFFHTDPGAGNYVGEGFPFFFISHVVSSTARASAPMPAI